MNNSSKLNKHKNILGISPGTRSIGISLFRHGDLIDYNVKNFTGKLSNKKLTYILKTIQKMVEEYSIDSIALKVPEGKTKSKGVKFIIEGIENIACYQKSHLLKSTISDLQKTFIPEVKANKLNLSIFLMNKFPELSYIEHCGYNRHTYYGKMFEAIAAGIQLVDK